MLCYYLAYLYLGHSTLTLSLRDETRQAKSYSSFTCSSKYGIKNSRWEIWKNLVGHIQTDVKFRGLSYLYASGVRRKFDSTALP